MLKHCLGEGNRVYKRNSLESRGPLAVKRESISHKAEESGNAGVIVYDFLPCLVFSELKHQKAASRLNTTYCSILFPIPSFYVLLKS